MGTKTNVPMSILVGTGTVVMVQLSFDPLDAGLRRLEHKLHRMSSPARDRVALEELWWQRLCDARLRVVIATTAAHDLALLEYIRVLAVYKDLTESGVIPDESEWLKVRDANRI
jgi:hypothetical protein